ncbi:unnamed protein product [Eretmochelys imbricata]
MHWLQGLERGCQPGPEEATLWMELCWEMGDCFEPSPRPPGKGQRLQAPPPTTALDTGEAVAGPEGGSRAWSLLRSLPRGSRAQGLVLSSLLGPPEAALGWREQARTPRRTGELQPPLMERPAAPCCSGRGHGLGSVSLPRTARLAPRVLWTGPGLPGARLPCSQAVP